MSQETFKLGFRELVCIRIRVFSCSLLSRGTRFVVGFSLYFPYINMAVRELFCIRIWLFSCPLVSRGVSSLVLFYFSPYQRDVSGIGSHKNLSIYLSFGVTWHMLFPQWCHSVFPSKQLYVSGNCSFSFLIY